MAGTKQAEAQELIVFTRYPEPGNTKTRLIPALGTQGAADLQREMTEATIQTASALDSTRITVAYEGGDSAKMAEWLGENVNLVSQEGRDLGEKMSNAFRHSFANGEDRAVIIGTDCPGLTVAIMERAFASLADNDLVIGPATDGGYYLIGLAQETPALFSGVSWGTERVFAQTREIAKSHGLQLATLPQLTDIDRPEDLEHQQQHPSPTHTVSVVIPTLNEEQHITRTLDQVLSDPSVEAIVVDGGSTDSTAAVAAAAGAHVLTVPGGRAAQMNAGASEATGTILLFLHADTLLPLDYCNTICEVLSDRNTAAGAFRLAIRGPGRGLRLVEHMVNFRSSVRGRPYGDQALFITRETFRKVRGFEQLPIMEDFDIVRRLRRFGRISLASSAVTTSPRRWTKLGVVGTTLINQAMIAGYYLGVSPHFLARIYRGNEPDRATTLEQQS
jgi:rSAM/selenodomain-associated transferase 2/rSAM/selenodomain-associated transferase 1